MSKIPKTVGELVEDAIKGAKVARGVAKDAKPLRNVLPVVTAKPSRIVSKPPVYRGKPYVAPQPTVRGQTVAHQYSDLKTAYKPEDIVVDRTIVNPVALDRPIIRPEDLQGGYIYGVLGDRSQAGTAINAINGVPLERSVLTEGGGNFMFDQQGVSPQAVWASSDAIIGRQANELNKLAQEGVPVYPNFTVMGGKGVDFNKEMSDLFSVSRGDIKPTDARRIDSLIKNTAIKKETKNGIKTVYPFKDFVGIASPDLDKWLRGLGGGQRGLFMNIMSKGSQQYVMGIPDIGALRIADTAPDLLHTPIYSSGYAIGRYDPSVGIIKNPVKPHSTYTSQLAGSPMGTFGVDLPYELVYRDWAKALAEKQLTKPSLTPYFHATTGGVTPIQKADQEWVDALSQAIENFRKLKEQQ